MKHPKASVFIATSLDGFISRSNGDIDWLLEANKVVPPGEDCGFNAFISTVDVLVMGRNTFEQVIGFDSWPYGDTRMIVLSSRPIAIPPHLAGTVSGSSESPEELVARLADEGAQHLYVDGGITIQRFLEAGLIDELTITTIPILLGDGKPLFGSHKSDIPLVHVRTHAYEFGFVQSVYVVAR
jgi:dihydrofolate reductase